MTQPVTLITGGSTGIGAATATRLLAEGHRVTVTGRDKSKLDRLHTALGSPQDLLTLPGDASDHDAVTHAVNTTRDHFGTLTAVIANAGFAAPDSVDATPDLMRDMVLTNVLGPVLLIQAALPALRESKGRIVLVGSVAGFVNSPGNVYGATKWAITGLAENIRRHVTDDGIGVTLIAPGRTDSEFWTTVGQTPEGHLMSADEVAATITWTLTQPPGVDINTVVLRPIGQPV